MSPPKTKQIAVIILNYNGRHLLDESLGSILAQKNSAVIQLYLADDASTDDSVAYVNKHYPTVKILKSTVNLGTAGVSNFAVSCVKEPYIVLASNDMRFDKNCISQLYQSITQQPNAGICTSVLLKHEPFPETNLYHIDNAGFDLDIFGFIKPLYRDQPQKNLPAGPFEVFASCGGCFIITKKLYFQLGGFDASFWSLSDDMDLCWRARLLGYKIYTNPKSFLYHHISATLKKSIPGKTRYLSERNNLTMLLKNYSLPSLILILPPYFVLEILEIFFHLITKNIALSKAVSQALIDNVLRLRATMLKRKIIQSTRTVPDVAIFRLLKFTSLKFELLSGQLGPTITFFAGGFFILLANYLGSFFNYVFHIIVGQTNSLSNFSQIESLLTLSVLIGYFTGAIGPAIINQLVNRPNSSIRQDISQINRLLIRFGIVLLSALTLAYFPLKSLLKLDNNPLYFLFILQSLAAFYLGCYQAVLQSRYKITAYLMLGVFFAVTKDIFAYFLSSYLGLFLATLATVFLCLFLINHYWPKSPVPNTSPSFSLSQFWRFSTLSFPANLFLSSILVIDTLFVRHFFSPERSAYYYTMSLIAKIVFFSASTILLLSFPKFIANRHHPNRLRQVFKQSFIFIFLVGALICLSLTLFPATIIATLYGSKFLPGAAYLPLYSICIFLYTLFYFLVQFLLSQNRHLSFIAPAIVFFIQILLFTFFHQNETTLINASIISLAAGIAVTLPNLRFLDSSANQSPV